jgi:dimethylamine monooxygenase subunit A
MSLAFKQETFRDDYTFRNSPEAIRRFPFPFPEDQYMYSVNIEPHTPGPKGAVTEFTLDVDEHYVAECRDKAITLEQDPGRCASLPHMMDAEWDFLEFTMESLARDYPEQFSLSKNGKAWTWINRPLGIEQSFVFGDAATLPMGPFEYMGRQVQGDFVLLDQREDTLFADAGIVTSQADWSLAFNVGMSWHEWHGPVPQVTKLGVMDRALKFLMSLQQANPVRRLNWTMTINPRLDTSPENYPLWGGDRNKVTEQNAGELAHLRVELQTLFRMPRSNAIVFSIRCYLISMQEMATYPRWAKRFHRVLRDLHPDLVEYKGITKYQQAVVAWLSRFDDGADIGTGTQPE